MKNTALRTRFGTGALAMGVGAAVVTTLAACPDAQAASYRVLTSSIAASSLKANDGYCSLAEAVASINQGSPAYGCTDFDPGGPTPGAITLVEAPGKPLANYHFVIGNLTLNRSVGIQPEEEGLRAFIDSTGANAFTVNAGATVTMFGVNVRHTGSGTGRLFWNKGTLQLSVMTIDRGNVTAESVAPNGKGGAIYNTGLLYVYGCQIQSNSAKKGGAIYNDNGQIPFMGDSTISNNSANAGGGIYNYFPSSAVFTEIYATATTISNNSAKAGAGVFNRGHVRFDDSAISFNTVATGSSGEGTCASKQSCDGKGGGIVSVAASSSSYARVEFNRTTAESNVAPSYGGAIYNAGQLQFKEVSIANNGALAGAAIYGATSGTNQYCSVEQTDNFGPSWFYRNSVMPAPSPTSQRASIVDFAIVAGVLNPPVCNFRGVFATENSTPACHSSQPVCPQ